MTKAKNQVFRPGDRLLVKVCHVEGQHKLGDRWELHPYIVLNKQLSLPVYVCGATSQWSDNGRGHVRYRDEGGKHWSGYSGNCRRNSVKSSRVNEWRGWTPRHRWGGQCIGTWMKLCLGKWVENITTLAQRRLTWRRYKYVKVGQGPGEIHQGFSNLQSSLHESQVMGTENDQQKIERGGKLWWKKKPAKKNSREQLKQQCTHFKGVLLCPFSTGWQLFES